MLTKLPNVKGTNYSPLHPDKLTTAFIMGFVSDLLSTAEKGNTQVPGDQTLSLVIVLEGLPASQEGPDCFWKSFFLAGADAYNMHTFFQR